MCQELISACYFCRLSQEIFHKKIILVNFFLPGSEKNLHFNTERIIPTAEKRTKGRGEKDLSLRFIRSLSDIRDIVRNVNVTDGPH